MDGFALIPLFCSVVFGTLTVVAVIRPVQMRFVFALFLSTSCLWSLGFALTRSNLSNDGTQFWGTMIITAGTPMLVAYYHFVRRFTGRKPGVLTIAGYAVALPVAIISTAGVFLTGAYYVGDRLYMYYIPHVTTGCMLFAFVYLLAAAVTLVDWYRASLNPFERRRALYLLLGLAFFMFFTLLQLIPFFSQYPLDYVGGSINALFITCVLLKYQLHDIRTVLKNGLVYSILTVFLSTIYLMLLFGIQLFFQKQLGCYSLVLAVILALMTAVLFNPVRDFLQVIIDKLFYHDTWDYRRVLLSFSNMINNVLDLDELQQNVLRPLVNTMGVRQAALMFPDTDSGDFTVRFVNGSEKDGRISRLRFEKGNPVITWLEETGLVFRRDRMEALPCTGSAAREEKVILAALGVEILCPIISRGTLIGLLALSKKRSGSPYNDDEADLLKTMANEAAVALENARMLESMKNQQFRVEQLLGQVVLAQEEERNRISIDLHDSVAQWLVAVTYGIQTFRRVLPGKNPDEADKELFEIEKTITKSLKELRRVVVGLRPPALDELGLTHAVKQNLDELEVEGIDCRYEQTGTPFRLPPNTEITIYRVVQEAMTNIRKHAGATRVRLSLEFQEKDITVEIADNGCGFNLSPTLNSAVSVGRLGLLGMRQRAEMLGGTMNVHSAHGAGTTLTFRFPAPALVHA